MFPEHARYKMLAAGVNGGTTYYLNDPVSGAMEEQFAGSTNSLRDYIVADGHMVAERFCTASGPICLVQPTFDYFVLDHLGSISVITNSTGAVLERLSYDAWGKRRNTDGSAAACGTISSSTIRGFTGQEMMDTICFVNLNARVYDPSLGRFMSAEKFGDIIRILLNQSSNPGDRNFWHHAVGRHALGHRHSKVGCRSTDS